MAEVVMRSGVGAFFHNYHLFTSIATLLALPASLSLLLAQAMLSKPSLLQAAISGRLLSIFSAAGFPDSPFFALLHLKLSQTIFTFILTLPFNLSFLLLAKAAVFAAFRQRRQGRRRLRLARPALSSVAALYPGLLITHLFNSFLILSANAAVFSILFLAFTAADLLHIYMPPSGLGFLLSVAGAVLYALVVGVATVVSNLAMVTSALDDECGAGHKAALSACVLLIIKQGRLSTALALALPTNLGMAASEALFHLRVVRAPSLMLWEASSIAYIRALFIVLEIIFTCAFYRDCTAPTPTPPLEINTAGDLEAPCPKTYLI